jgi:acyl carrier protein
MPETGPSSMSTVDTLKDLIHRHFGIAPERIDAQEPFTTYAMDSLTLAELSFAIEEELHARVPDAQMQQVQTLAQLADVLDSLREPQRA